MKKNLWLIVLIGLFIIDLILVKTSLIDGFDNLIYQVIIALKSDNMTSFFKFITFLASTKFIIFANIMLIIYMIWKKRYDLSLVTICSIASVVINNLVKLIIQRDRPLDIALIEETFYSFPSGHAMISICFYGSLIYLFMRNKPMYHRLRSYILGIIIFLVGVSRIYLGVHFASDVIGGYLLGSIVVWMIIIIRKHIKVVKR